MNKLQTSIEYLKGVGPFRADLLKKELQIYTLMDLLTHYPFRYIDRSQVYKINEVRVNASFVQVQGKVVKMAKVGKPRSQRLIAYLQDDTGIIELVWFRGLKWLENYLKEGSDYLVFGKPNSYKGKISIPHPEMSGLGQTTEQAGIKLQPVYPSTEKLTSKNLDSRGIQKLCNQLLSEIGSSEIPEILPDSIIRTFRFISRMEAFKQIHFPESQEMLNQASRRLKFDEFFLIQLQLLKRKLFRKKIHNGYTFPNLEDYFNRFYHENLSFELTGAQKKVLKEIRKDVLTGMQMNRLLQGDVGSGKTVVALMAMLMAADNGFQSSIMAPTEILARQHYESILEMVKGLGLNVAILTGSVKGAPRKQLLRMLKDGDIHILIGTHALIEETVIFKNLGLVVIDEQHRFGVAQRARLWTKNEHPPHILVMTATPIPRTLAMTLYGDLDTSVIDELPPGRKEIKTIHQKDKQRLKIFGFLKKEIMAGRQVYIVYPLIQESAKLDYKDLMDGYESIVRAFPPPEFRVSIVHGQMKADDKDAEMKRFSEGKSQIMVATTVIEVGVNVTNATIMLIESAEKFGLAQLHQLRGRVGRGADQSYCILMSGYKLSEDARKRLQTMVETTDGFRIAEVDMAIRGPGDLEGTRQSGLDTLKLANIMRDADILQSGRLAAQKILKDDPELNKKENLPLRNFIRSDKRQLKNWGLIS